MCDTLFYPDISNGYLVIFTYLFVSVAGSHQRVIQYVGGHPDIPNGYLVIFTYLFVSITGSHQRVIQHVGEDTGITNR